MPQALRTNAAARKIVYNILKTPKNQQQHNQKRPPEKLIQAWNADTLQGR